MLRLPCAAAKCAQLYPGVNREACIQQMQSMARMYIFKLPHGFNVKLA